MARAPVHLHYATVSALRAMAAMPWRRGYNSEQVDKYLTDVKRAEWLGIEGGAPAALKALTDGYPKGEKLVRTFHDEIKADLPRAEGHHRTKVRSAMGDELDVHAMMRGAHDRSWTSSVRRVRKGSGVLRLVVDIGANGHTSADELQWRGIAGLSLAEVMSKAGYAVEIVAAFAVQGTCKSREEKVNDKVIVSVVVKPRSAQPDYGLLAATVALPAFFRTLGFAAIVRHADDQNVNVDDGLGHYLDVSGVLPVPDKVTQLMVPQSVINRQTAVDFVRQSVTLLQG